MTEIKMLRFEPLAYKDFNNYPWLKTWANSSAVYFKITLLSKKRFHFVLLELCDVEK